MSSTLHIDSLTYGPHGIGRLGGKAIFVRGVVPGEEVEVEIREDKGSFAYADAVRWIRSADDRRQPPCRYLPRCGGCPWQHVEYTAQLRAKEDNLRDALRRIAATTAAKVLPVMSAPAELGYRSRLSLRVADRQVGFYAGGSHDLVAVEHCLLAMPDVDTGIAAAAELVVRLGSDIRRIEIGRRGFAPGIVLAGEIEGGLANEDAEVIDAWLSERADVAGIVLQGKRWRRVWGDDRIAIAPQPEVTLFAAAGAFTQVNPEANRMLVRTVLELGDFQREEAVLDLYAGAGNLTLPIARRVRRVVGMEHDELAVRAARDNAERVPLGNVEMIRDSVPRGLRRQLRAGAYFDSVVCDPPRSGAAEAIDALLELSPRKLVYVSCNPATLARDLGRLAVKYRVEAVQPIDLFPQTYHLETVVRATRRGG